jgi:hypothetical protein
MPGDKLGFVLALSRFLSAVITVLSVNHLIKWQQREAGGPCLPHLNQPWVWYDTYVRLCGYGITLAILRAFMSGC